MSRGTPRQHPSAPASRRPAPPCRPCTCRRKYFCAGLKNIFVTTYIPGDLGGRIRVAGLAVELQLLADGGVGELGAGRGVVGGVGGVAEEEAGVARLEVNLRRGGGSYNCRAANEPSAKFSLSRKRAPIRSLLRDCEIFANHRLKL